MSDKTKKEFFSAALDQCAMDLFGERMQALGFTTFKYHRWYKLIRDEVLLSFGLVPFSGSYDLYLGIQPLFVSSVPHFAQDNYSEPPFVQDIDSVHQGLKYPFVPRTCSYTLLPEFAADGLKGANEVFTKVVQPILGRIQSITDAFEEIQWCDFIVKRYFKYTQLKPRDDTPPTLENYRTPFCDGIYLAYCFFQMYDECFRRYILLHTYHWDAERQKPIYPDYETALAKMEALENPPEEYVLLRNRAYEEIDQRLHREYENTLRMIKRRLKLEPDCSDTIWDRDYRHPIDIRQMLQERFDRCAPRAAQGDYTIDFI